MRLGRIEKSILLAILDHPCFDINTDRSDIQRSELIHLIFGYEPTYKFDHYEYPGIPRHKYMSMQASLTRALQSLFLKGFIDCGESYNTAGYHIYSEKRAAAHNIEPAKPLSDKELDKKRPAGDRDWTYRGSGSKPMCGRNIKGISLTKKGMEKAEQLNVK